MADLDWVYGIHAVENALGQDGKVKEVRLQEGRDDKKMQRIIKLCQAQKIRISQVPRRDLDQLFSKSKERVVHQGVVALAEVTKTGDEKDLERLVKKLDAVPLIVILDGVTDPHKPWRLFA